jgi:hypothetical protein
MQAGWMRIQPGVGAVRTRFVSMHGDIPRDLRVNVARCVRSHDAASDSVAAGDDMMHQKQQKKQ